jgi:hypothetical protein
LLRLTTVAAIVFFVLWALAIANYKIGNVLGAVLSKDSIIFITQSVLSIILGVVASIMYSAFENKAYRSQLDEIFSAGPRELVDAAITLLRRHKQALVYDYNVEYTLTPHASGKCLIMRVRFSYKKRLSERDLYFRVMRLKRPEDEAMFSANQVAVDSLYTKSELFYWIDEVDLRRQIGDDPIESAYSFEHLKIGGSPVSPSAVPTDPGSLYARIADNIDLGSPVAIEYAFRFAVPLSDVQFCMAEYPTKGTRIRFERDSALRPLIGGEAFELMSATEGNAAIVEDSPGVHVVSHDGWLLPKSGAVFHWYPLRSAT